MGPESARFRPHRKEESRHLEMRCGPGDLLFHSDDFTAEIAEDAEKNQLICELMLMLVLLRDLVI